MVTTIIVLFVLFYEPPLEVGKITDIHATHDTVLYDQHCDPKYHYITRYRTVTKYRTDAKGNRTPYSDTESYQDRVFDHNEYYIERHFNGTDYIVTFEAPSEKRWGKMRKAVVYITKDRYETLKDSLGQTFTFVKEYGDLRYDANNTAQEVDRQWYDEFNLNQWMASHNVENVP